MSKQINIGGRIHSTEVGNVSVGANEVLDDTKGKKQNVINADVDAELLRLDQSKQDNLTFDNAPTENSNNPVKSNGVYAADKALSDAIEAILLLIPSAATALNQLADKAFVNSSVSTDTATFRGTYNVVTDLELAYDATHEQIATKLGQVIATADNNDYAFVQVPVSVTSTDIRRTERYKFNGTVWGYEYDLNTSGFTAVQWEAINSGITALLVSKLTNLPTAEVLATMFAAKQDTLTFDTAPTALSTNPVTSGGLYTTIKAITDLIPAEATTTNQLADKAYVLASILAATPAFKGQFTSLVDLQAVSSPKAGDIGIVRTKDSDGYDVFTFYQYLNDQWNVYFSLSYHPQTKPATTGTTGDYPYNGMGRVELPMNMVGGVNTLTQSMMPTATGGNTVYVIKYDFTLGEDIYVPANCVLEFDGGSISNGSITGNTTLLVFDKPFISSVSLLGTFYTLVDTIVDTDVFKDSNYNTNRIHSILNIQSPSNKYIFKKATYNNVEEKVITHNMDIDFSGSTINLKLEESVDNAGIQTQFLVMPFNERGEGLQLDFFRLNHCKIVGNTEYVRAFDNEWYRGTRRRLITLFNVKDVNLDDIDIQYINPGRTGTYTQDLQKRWELSLVDIFYYNTAKVNDVHFLMCGGDNLIYAVPNIGENFLECCYCSVDTPDTYGTGLLLLLNGQCDIHHNYFTKTASSALNLPGIYNSKIHDNIYKDGVRDVSGTAVDGDCIDFGYNDYHARNVEVYNNHVYNYRIFLIAHGYDISIHNNIAEVVDTACVLGNNNATDSDFNIANGHFVRRMVLRNNKFNGITPLFKMGNMTYDEVVLEDNEFYGSANGISTNTILSGLKTVIRNNIFGGYFQSSISTSKQCCFELRYRNGYGNPTSITIEGNTIKDYNAQSENYPIFIVRDANVDFSNLLVTIANNIVKESTAVQSDGVLVYPLTALVYGNIGLKHLSDDVNVSISDVTKIIPKGTHALDSNGKSIWWNGTQWVDATGTPV